MSTSKRDGFSPYAILNIAVYLKYEIFYRLVISGKTHMLKRPFVVDRDNIVTPILLNIYNSINK